MLEFRACLLKSHQRYSGEESDIIKSLQGKMSKCTLLSLLIWGFSRMVVELVGWWWNETMAVEGGRVDLEWSLVDFGEPRQA